ncbi:MAG TPA: cobyric acid synthase [Bryobacteraceae bacterium]|nr:cobyric acid synthase [Bryobacteraceae bacterium]
MSAKALFVGGTASHAGKSWFTTAICRYLRNRGLRVAPFKAQNMSNNSGPCRISLNGAGATSYGEIGRAQIAQAEACGLEPETDMNPILLKPHSDKGSQVVVNGRIWRDLSASAYYDNFPALLQHVLDAYERLATRYEFIVIEGAGSVAEMNLKARDLVNFGLAERVGAPAVLVADIDRGGVFGSVVGTLSLLTGAELTLVRSFAVNRFRGEPTLFHDGVSFLEDRTGRPCVGVFPYVHGVALDDEDGVSLDDKSQGPGSVAIVRLPHVSNFNEFDRLSGAVWLSAPDRTLYDAIILPGTKNTIGDLRWMRTVGFDTWIQRQHAAGAQIVGVCGGFQILGEVVDGEPGLGLLPADTTTLPDKVVRPVRAMANGTCFNAYEIHMGVTDTPRGATPFATVNGRPEGIRVGRCSGTYLHDALRSDAVLQMLGLQATAKREPPYDTLASWFESNADTRLFEELYL